eukprot:m.619969 g.619969  ORF g.619969 m.619969 type:complete len:319 (+) comp22530_c1_seq11:3140-4096(+)
MSPQSQANVTNPTAEWMCSIGILATWHCCWREPAMLTSTLTQAMRAACTVTQPVLLCSTGSHYGSVHVPPAGNHGAAPYDNKEASKDVDIFDKSVAPLAATGTYGALPDNTAEFGDELPAGALDHLLRQYGKPASGAGSNADVAPDPNRRPSMGQLIDDDDDPQPAPVTIETLHGAGGDTTSGEASPVTALMRYQEALACEPTLYTASAFSKKTLAAHLRAACRKGHYTVVENLLKFPEIVIDGARKGGSGKTALHIVAEKGYLKILDMLLAKHANPFVRDKSGKIPLDYATQKRLPQVTEKLKDAMMMRGLAHDARK